MFSHSHVFSTDYMSALMLYWRYYIGGYFDDVIYDWKWINGSVIDPNHLMNYPVAGIPGVCLLWTDIDYLYDYPCDMIFPSICEIPIKGKKIILILRDMNSKFHFHNDTIVNKRVKEASFTKTIALSL